MGLREYELQWQSIMANNMFSEAATITDGEDITVSVRGVFFSGSYDEDSPAAYSPRRLVQKEFFRISSLEIPNDIEEPWKTFVGMKLILDERNLQFRIYEVAGKRGGTFTFELQELTDGTL